MTNMPDRHTVDSRSPLGRYAALVASISAIGVLALWAVSELLYGLGYLVQEPSSIRTAALLTLGAIFGSAAFLRPIAPIEPATPPARAPRRSTDPPDWVEPEPLPPPSKSKGADLP